MLTKLILSISALTLASCASTTQLLPTSLPDLPPSLADLPPSLAEDPPAFRLLRLPKSTLIMPASAIGGENRHLDSERFTKSYSIHKHAIAPLAINRNLPLYTYRKDANTILYNAYSSENPLRPIFLSAIQTLPTSLKTPRTGILKLVKR